MGLSALVLGGVTRGQGEDIPEEFLTAPSNDAVANLLAGIKAGKVKLEFEPNQGYLRSLLKELKISASSQVLVFSKTSLQSAFISPETPRALYFNDQAYVGWIPGAPYMEIVGVDPVIGPVFYLLENHKSLAPTPKRQTMECFQCHDSPMTGHVPGVMARSVYAGPDGQLRLANGSFRTTAMSPMKERWGGWYVTGVHGTERHMGNEAARGDEQASTIDIEKGANVTDLSRYFRVDSYLTPHSDIVALMVAEQQMGIQNLITKAGLLTRKAEKDGQELLKFGFSQEHVDEGIRDRISGATEPLVKALLAIGEPVFTSPIQGTSRFAVEYSASSPADKQGRRLSELDLKAGLMKYSCSPMIYSKSFEGLPLKAKEHVYRRLGEILGGQDKGAQFTFLSATRRNATREILIDTMPDAKPFL